MKKLFILFFLFLVINANAQKPILQKQIPPLYTEKLFQYENIYIGPQPNFDDFASIKAAGITTVINMRTPSEIEKLEFHEDYLLKKAGINYHLLPIGGKEFEYSPAKLEEFAKSLSASEGKILLHCASGHRASQLWAAYMVKYKGKTPDEALAMVKDMGWWPMPMEIMLGKKLHVSFSE